MEVTKLFDNILDLPGIEGVCLFGTDGQMYVNRLPTFLSNELFADAQRRIVAMYETMDENFLPCDDYMLRFSERWLLLRRTDNHVMLILGGEKANLASTRMVTNMTIKHITPAILAQLAGSTPQIARTQPSAASPAPAPAAVPAAPAPVVAPALAPASAASVESPAEPAKPVRMYRGRAY
ncbi:MAG: hypothetical protein MUE42_14385 [Opitutaceae bacterium]|jgi:hypothetical protein|nr:hypothetical protein [Opitutaceae bacterium]